ncbi:gfo/Idh/MocA family oxidoreductase, partial [Lutimaribacter sp. EGI FJ00014]|nr:gfo/Idh/MocA family oxidoreductase [Lutimaribacter sp. EGI FJ00014]
MRAMEAGKDVIVDKPGVTTFEQLEAVERTVARTGRIFSVCFSERLCVPSAVVAGKMVADGAVGKVVQTLGVGPHRKSLSTRPGWFFEMEAIGGVINDIASHQIDQFLFYTGSDSAEVVASSVGNLGTPQSAEFQDFGEVLLRSAQASGYIRVDWFTPDGLPTWGDGRLTILGTE